jgi:hypothetical protein
MVELPSGLSTRRSRDVQRLAVSVVVIALTVVPMTEMLVAAWQARGIGEGVAVAVATVLPLGFDAVVVFPAGLVVGWLSLFLFDRSKVMQALLLVLASGPVLLTLWLNDVWFSGAVDWVASVHVLLTGFAVGVVSGAADKLLAAVTGADVELGVKYREFPLAAIALFLSTLVVGLVGFVDLHVLSSTTALGATYHFVATGAFVGLVGYFVQYTDRKDVLLLSPSRETETLIVAGLYDYLEDEYEVVATQGGDELSRLLGNLDQDAVVPVRESEITFYFRRPGWFSRWTSISTSGYENSYLLNGHLERMASEVESHGGPVDRLKDAVWGFRSLEGVIGNRTTRDFVDRVLLFDVVLLLVPLNDDSVSRAFDTDRDDETVGGVDFITKYCQLSQNLDGTDVDATLVATHGDIAIDYYETLYEPTKLDAPEFVGEVDHRLGDLAADHDSDERLPCSVTVLSRDRATERDPLLLGVRRLLKDITER